MTRCATLIDIAQAVRKARLRDLSRNAESAVRAYLADTPTRDRVDAIRALARATREQCVAVLGEASTVALFGSLAHSDFRSASALIEAAEQLFGGTE